MSKLPPGWSLDVTNGYRQYVRSDGARVYQYRRRAWRGACWGAYVPAWSSGTEVASTRADAIAYVERHYPIMVKP